MRYPWITLNNVTAIAQAILDLDITLIEERYQADIKHWTLSLQDALNQYRYHCQPTSTPALSPEAHANLLHYDLEKLLGRTHNILPLLKPEAQQTLQAGLFQWALSA